MFCLIIYNFECNGMFHSGVSRHSESTEKNLHLLAWGVSNPLRNGDIGKGLAGYKTAVWVRSNVDASKSILGQSALPQELVAFVPRWIHNGRQNILVFKWLF